MASTIECSPKPPVSLAIEGCRRFVVRRRVPISLVLVTTLVAEDVLLLERPHLVFDAVDAWSVAGLLLILAGLLLRSWAAGILQKNECLATSGPYAITRNPLYLGSFLMMFGFCAVIGDLDNFAFMGILIVLVYIPVILHEQRRLGERFGVAWEQYSARTPILVPRRYWISLADWSAATWRKNNEHRALIGTLSGLLAMAAWYQIMSSFRAA